MPGGELLSNLDAAPVTVHIAEAADIHQDVEAELLSGAERAQHFIMLAAMPQSQVDDLAANVFSRSLVSLAGSADTDSGCVHRSA